MTIVEATMRPISRVTAIAAAVLVLAAAPAAWAGPATDQVKAAVEQVLKVVQDPELKKPANVEKRRGQIREIARTIFDFEELSKRALARHWTARTPAEQKRFTELFTDLLENSYISKIEAYSGEKVLYLPEQVDGDTVIVRSRLVTQKGAEVPLDYKTHKRGERFQAYDVLVEGVSLVANYRTQFNSIISRSSYEGLVKRLEAKQVEDPKPGKPAPKTQ
jgi:phospholipid transport system substrate-binding protein